jgi:hypothetical protein
MAEQRRLAGYERRKALPGFRAREYANRRWDDVQEIRNRGRVEGDTGMALRFAVCVFAFDEWRCVLPLDGLSCVADPVLQPRPLGEQQGCHQQESDSATFALNRATGSVHRTCFLFAVTETGRSSGEQAGGLLFATELHYICSMLPLAIREKSVRLLRPKDGCLEMRSPKQVANLKTQCVLAPSKAAEGFGLCHKQTGMQRATLHACLLQSLNQRPGA